MRVVILASRPGWHTDELLRVFAERGHLAALARYEDLVATVRGGTAIGSGAADLSGADLVLARIIPNGSLEQIIFRVDALHALEERGVRVVNSARLIERTVDKFWTSATLERHGLPTPATIVCESIEAAYHAREQLGGDVIVKPLFGSMGLGMVRVSDEETAFRVFRAIEAIRGVFYLQRAIDHDGRDIRAFVVGSRVIAAIERRAPGWRTNLARGGEARAVALPSAWSELAVRAAEAVGAVYAGVDLLPARDGTVHVLEVNGIPGWQGLQQATGVGIAGVLVEHLLREPIASQP
jgi:RimK family alpha-L-glutamate ligase